MNQANTVQLGLLRWFGWQSSGGSSTPRFDEWGPWEACDSQTLQRPNNSFAVTAMRPKVELDSLAPKYVACATHGCSMESHFQISFDQHPWSDSEPKKPCLHCTGPLSKTIAGKHSVANLLVSRGFQLPRFHYSL